MAATVLELPLHVLYTRPVLKVAPGPSWPLAWPDSALGAGRALESAGSAGLPPAGGRPEAPGQGPVDKTYCVVSSHYG